MQATIEFCPAGRILHANTRLLSMMRYSLDEVKNQHHSLFVEPSERGSSAYRRLWESLGRGEPQVATSRLLAKGGHEVWAHTSYKPMLDRAGKPVKIITFVTDLTVQTLQALDLDGQITALHRSQAVIAFTPDGTILTANFNFLDALGYRLEEVQGQHHSLFVAKTECTTGAYQEFWAALARGEFQSGEYCRLGKDGREVWIQAT